ncbi:MAG TPA: protein kinase [Kofleriaceae bacterium]|nr:protein kinase [Kofleriaceae bacterium]
MEALRERFGKYHVLEKIAQGGMAEVYKVKTVGIAGFEKVQALKRILPASAREGRFIRSFIDEARIAVELTHRNIVQVFDFGKADGELFLAMELIEGRDLRTAVAQATAASLPCPIPVAAYILGEVAAGLDYAHRKTDLYGSELNIVHCDVSPSNVMLSADGYVKILDFGIARATFASALERRRLRGKPRYMAPEQTYGEPPTAAADVFALGIIGWELFTGLALYRGADLKAILEAVRTQNPPRVDRLDPKVPEEIANAIERALNREQSARGTAADLVAACARTALLGGAHTLAGWLDEIAVVVPAQPEAAKPAAAPVRAPTTPPRAPSTRPTEPPVRPSQTMSLNHAVPRPQAVGEGTPGFEPALKRAASGFERERTTTATADQRKSAPLIQRFGDRDPTVTAATPMALPIGMLGEPTVTTPAHARQTWGHESTSAGVGRLADALREPTQSIVVPVPEPELPAIKTTYGAFVPAPGFAPSATRFDDDDATQHAAVATSFDDLVVEPEPPAGDAPAVDEVIDDDLAALETPGVVERRRTVVVAGVLDGAPSNALRPIARALAELAYQRGGVALALEADALVVAFGLEVAGEDDVAIAMGWALDAAQLVRDGTAASGARLRIGAKAGVAATTNAEGGARIPPDAIDEARALARDAQAERPLFIGGAGRLTSDLFELREVAHRLRRGRVLELIGPRGFEERDRARGQRRGAFVGRGAQLAELDRWYERVVADTKRATVLVSGAAGTGKSRLIGEFALRARDREPELRIVSIAANPASRLSPFSMVIELYQAALGQPPSRGRTARTQLSQRLNHVLKSAGVADELARAVATDLDRAMELQGGVGTGAPEVSDLRPRLSAGLATFRAAMRARERRRLTVIEDIHLADGPSLEVLRHSLGAPAEGAELVILSSRPEAGEDALHVDAKVAVEDLVGAELRALIADRLGPAATPEHIAAVIARGGGNPLFVDVLAGAVREAAERGDGASGSEIPASARDVALARIDRLSPRARAAVRFAAAMNGVVRVRIVEELLGDDGVEDTGGGDAFGELVTAGVLVRASGDDGELEFARGLVREVVYDAMPLRAQRDSHARIGRLLAARFFAGREEPPAVIASHLERGGDLAAAAAFWLRAGRLAMTASDADDAVACFTRTLELEHELGEAPVTAAGKTRRREAYAGRELANRLRGDLASHADDVDQLQLLCDDDAHRLADVAIRRAHRLLRTGEFSGAMVATVVAEDLAAGASDSGRLAGEALRVRAELLERLGRFDEALDVVERSRALFAEAGAVVEEMQAMVGRGRILLMRASYAAARAVYQPIIARLEQAGDPWLERVVQNHLAIVEMCLGNYALAMQSAQRSLELCRRYGDRAREGDALSVAGIIQLEVGLYDQATATFDEALAVLARSGTRWSRADCLIYAGACANKRGNHDAALALLDEALDEAQAIGARYLEANALVTRAGTHLARGSIAQAIVDATNGASVARAAGLAGYELQGLARHAAALVRTSGDHLREAGALIDRALALFDKQEHLEGSEEDVYMHCVAVLRALGDGERANRVKARAKAEVIRKSNGLADPTWRAAYLARVECRALLS